MSEHVLTRRPIFCVVLKDGEHWQVEAEWPDGTIEPVQRFKAGFEALDWVKTRSAAWLAERVEVAICPAGIDAHRGALPVRTTHSHTHASGRRCWSPQARHPISPETITTYSEPKQLKLPASTHLLNCRR
jgi:hypothetical protein